MPTEVDLATPGLLVEAFGLHGAPELNGCRGHTNGRAQGGRVGVCFPEPHGTKALRLANLKLLELDAGREERAENEPITVLELVRSQPFCDMHHCTSFANLLWKRLVPEAKTMCRMRSGADPPGLSSGFHSFSGEGSERVEEPLQQPLPADLWPLLSEARGRTIWYLGLHALSHACILETMTNSAGELCGYIYQSWIEYSGVGNAGFTVGEWLSPADSQLRATTNHKEILAAKSRWGSGRLLTASELKSFCSELQVLREEFEHLRAVVLVPYIEGNEEERQEMLDGGSAVEELPNAQRAATEWLQREASGTNADCVTTSRLGNIHGERLHFQPYHPDLDVPFGHCVLFLGTEANNSAKQLLAWPLESWREPMHRHARLFGEFPAFRSYVLMMYLPEVENRWQYAVNSL